MVAKDVSVWVVRPRRLVTLALKRAAPPHRNFLTYLLTYLLRFYIKSQLGGGSPQLLIGNELRHLSVAVCGLVSTGQATQPWRNSLLTMTTTSSGKCYTMNIMYWNNFFLTTNHQYHLRQRRHNHCLTVKTDDRNFVTRQLFKDLYWNYVHTFSPIFTSVAFCQYSFFKWMKNITDNRWNCYVIEHFAESW